LCGALLLSVGVVPHWQAGAARPDLRVHDLRRYADKEGALIVLAVGINKYDAPGYAQQFAKADAEDFAAAVERLAAGRPVTKIVLSDETATREFIEAAFKRVIDKARPEDTFIFHFAGLGFNLPGATPDAPSDFYLFPSDMSIPPLKTAPLGPAKRAHAAAQLSKPTPARADEGTWQDSLRQAAAKGISTRLLASWCAKIEARNQLLVLDSCDSAENFRTVASRIAGGDQELRELLAKNVIVLGTTGLTVESKAIGHGELTYALLQGLQGEADGGARDGVISVRELEGYFYNKFTQLSLARNGNSRPASSTVGGDFPLGRLPGATLTVGAAAAPAQSPAEQPAAVEPAPPPAQATRGDKPAPSSSSVSHFAVELNAPPPRKGRDYALLIATDKYDELQPLSNPVQDAHKIADELRVYYGFQTEIVENPTRTELKATLRRYLLKKDFTDEDQLFIFIAGHGVYAEETGEGYLAARDSKRNDEFRDTYLSHADLRTIVNNIPCKHILLVLDACFGGAFDEGTTGARFDPDEVTRPEQVARSLLLRARLYLTSGGRNYVPDGRPGASSPFARKLLEALRSGGGERGLLTFARIITYVETAKPKPHKGDFGNNDPGSDFVFIARRQPQP
jgi:uncharacterized caspase-like protein